jgi:hypothetical protein
MLAKYTKRKSLPRMVCTAVNNCSAAHICSNEFVRLRLLMTHVIALAYDL